MEKVRTVLKEVFDKPPVAEFNSTCEMFGSLRNLCSFLPEQKKDEFFSSLNRVKLEYVIDRLLCKPGLLTAAQALHTSGLAEPVPAAQTLHGSMLLKHTLSYMNSVGKPERIMVSLGSTRYTEYGNKNYLQKSDETLVILYPESRYTKEKIASLVENRDFSCDDIIFLNQKKAAPKGTAFRIFCNHTIIKL